eukprot:m.99158 g.99158  ORF g.99158 m.99158 type:complete len:124 (+) comp12450_c0_seq7:2478-2849(+)
MMDSDSEASAKSLISRLLPHTKRGDDGTLVVSNYIGGEWIPTEKTLKDFSPATSEGIAHIPRSDARDVDRAVAAAAQAQRTATTRDKPALISPPPTHSLCVALLSCLQSPVRATRHACPATRC